MRPVIEATVPHCVRETRGGLFRYYRTANPRPAQESKRIEQRKYREATM